MALNTMQDAAPVPAQAGPSFLHTVGAPLVWIGVGYLLATLMQRPTRRAAT